MFHQKKKLTKKKSYLDITLNIVNYINNKLRCRLLNHTFVNLNKNEISYLCFAIIVFFPHSMVPKR